MARARLTGEREDVDGEFERLFVANERRLRQFLLQMLRDRTLAEDLLRDTFLAAYVAWGKYDRSADAGAWLFGIARHRALRAIRGRRRMHSAIDRLLRVTATTTQSFATSVEVMDLLDRALTPDERSLVLLRYVHDFDAVTLAEPDRSQPCGDSKTAGTSLHQATAGVQPMNLTAYEEHAIRELLRPLRDIDTDQSATSANATEPPRPHRRRLLLAEVGVVLATLLVITGLVVLARGHHASAPATNPHHHRAPNLPKHQLLAPNAVPGDTFGQSVAMFGRTALVGAPTTDHGRGVVYVYTRRTSGTWRLRQTITARDSKRGDYFGMSVAISGSTIFVGATHRSHDEGAAYVFVRSGGHWVQAQELGANHATTDQLFGNAVAVGPGYAVVCGMGDQRPPAPATAPPISKPARDGSTRRPCRPCPTRSQESSLAAVSHSAATS